VPPARARADPEQPLDLRNAAVKVGSGVNEVVDVC
jgi:hypothetical protein